MNARSRRFDVVCCGAGPAGSLCALLLAQAGHSVLLLERARLPRDKACGGGLSARALALLPAELGALVHRRIDGARLCIAGATLADIASSGIGAMIERREFDAWLGGLAVQAGAELWSATALTGFQQDHHGVTVETARGPVRAALLVGADGAHSRVRQLAFPWFRPDWAFGLEARFHDAGATAAHAPPADLACFDFGTLTDGYGWIFPKRDHWNAGVYRLRKPRRASSLRERLDGLVEQHALLGACHADAAVGHPIPLSDGRQPLADRRVLLVGDAAGLGEAFLGEGIAFALDSARRAAAWVTRALQPQGIAAAGSYAAGLQGLADELRHSQRIARLLYRLPPPLLRRAAADRGVQQLVVDLLAGRRSYRASFRSLLWRVPLALATGRAAPGLAAH